MPDRDFESLFQKGYFIRRNVFTSAFCESLRSKMDLSWKRQLESFGADLLSRMGDYGCLRTMMAEDPYFFELITHSEILEVVARVIGETAILHLQNGLIVFPQVSHHQGRFHKDFAKDFLSTQPLSLNAFLAVDDFTEESGATWVVPRSHLSAETPSEEFLRANEVQLRCPAGSIIFFDSNLWHRAGTNLGPTIRRGINHQYTRPFIKQQIDYPALLKGKVEMESKLAQVLGFWSVPPKSVEEFRVNDPSQRTYRAGQG